MDLQSPLPATSVRRNPPRRAKVTPVTHDRTFSNSSNTAAVVRIKPFPLDELPESGSRQKNAHANQNTTKPSDDPTNNLKVFLRVRPLQCGATKGLKVAGGETRTLARGKVAKELEVKSSPCLFVNSSNSVTLCAPPSAMNSKRANKSEIYDGFSHVFSPESRQEDVYDKLMQPLVKDFIEGHSSLLVAMGSTGSGKTYTMFGSPQQLGIVPLALSQIFSQKPENEFSHASRTFYLSMFEIYSERGKGENIFDLSPGSPATLNSQTSISNVKEIKITTVADAENIVSHGLLKRSTASTNANNQSSRSQCIVNVRCVVKNDTDGHSIGNAVLTIADLAGAERERKTGNQGSRLMESSFINNTSMVFGQCLRSLLEHQKNPKKLIEKHFKNSLLTRYLQDYMEGKKRMTLILTVKAAQEDYVDTSFILRQAAPFMKIKFNHLQENKNGLGQKGNPAANKTERNKRRKVDISEVSLADGNHVVMDVAPIRQIFERVSVEEECVGKHINAKLRAELQKIKRSEEVMTNFARTFWRMLKQYKHMIKLAENEVRNLKDSLREQGVQATKLEKELKELRNCCSCLCNPPIDECTKALSYQIIAGSSIISYPNQVHDSDALLDEYQTPTSAEASEEAEMDQDATRPDESLFIAEPTDDMDKLTLSINQDTLEQFVDEDPHDCPKVEQSNMLVGGMDGVVMDLPNVANFAVAQEVEDCISVLPESREASILEEKTLNQLEIKETVFQKAQLNANSNAKEILTSEKDDPTLKLLNSKKPKRKLLPAAEMLLDLNGIYMDENVKGNKRLKAHNVKERSDGSLALIRMLKSKLPS